VKIKNADKLFTLIITTHCIKYLLTKHGVTTMLNFVNANICREGIAMEVKAHMDLCFTVIP
jgi:hypothetical protein